jgi:hypothetical protein
MSQVNQVDVSFEQFVVQTAEQLGVSLANEAVSQVKNYDEFGEDPDFAEIASALADNLVEQILRPRKCRLMVYLDKRIGTTHSNKCQFTRERSMKFQPMDHLVLGGSWKTCVTAMHQAIGVVKMLGAGKIMLMNFTLVTSPMELLADG